MITRDNLEHPTTSTFPTKPIFTTMVTGTVDTEIINIVKPHYGTTDSVVYTLPTTGGTAGQSIILGPDGSTAIWSGLTTFDDVAPDTGLTATLDRTQLMGTNATGNNDVTLPLPTHIGQTITIVNKSTAADRTLTVRPTNMIASAVPGILPAGRCQSFLAVATTLTGWTIV